MSVNDVLKSLWGIELLKLDMSAFCEYDSKCAAVILATNSKNFARFEKLESFVRILEFQGLKCDKYNIQSAQARILNGIAKLLIPRNDVILGLSKLFNEGILDERYYEILKEFLLLLNCDEVEAKSAQNLEFHKNLDNLNALSAELKALCDNELLKSVEKAHKNANEANFSLALSGVINAGKSSLLNAMVGTDLLGVSNVPQTASICVLEHAKKPFVRVEFLRADEQTNLEPKKLEDKEIDPSDIELYTSANSELSKYVKSCVFGFDSEILKDARIIDTPGIDDAVRAREELSKEYLKNCDALLYLMNGAQASSKKDMDFLKNILKSTKNSQVIVVLTHIDKLSMDERVSVLEYTQRSVLEELLPINEELAKSVKYFLVSAPKNIGINELKAYLMREFFGSQKAELILSSYKKELELIANSLFNEFESTLRAFGASGNEAQNEILRLKNESENLSRILENTNEKISNILAEIDNEKISLDNEISAISARICDRVINELKYCKSNKQKADISRVFAIANSAFNDFLIDLMREKKYILEQKLSHFSAVLKELLGGFDFALIDFKEFLKNLEFHPDLSELKAVIKGVCENSNDLEKSSSELKNSIKNFCLNLGLEKEIKSLFSECAREFRSNLLAKFDELKAQNQARNLRILDLLENNEQKGQSSLKEKEKISANLQSLIAIKERLERC